MKSIDRRSALTIVLLCASIIILGYIPSQSDFSVIISCFTVAFAGYGWICYRGELATRYIITIAIVLRLALVFSFPQLSDDIFRFIWDGRMIHAGLDPYAHLPSEIVGSYPMLTKSLYDQLNSPQYYTIYTPLNQLLNFVCTIPNSSSLIAETIIYKTQLFIFEIVGLYYLHRLVKAKSWEKKVLALYALNPLLIVEVMGNCHFEGVMLSMLIVMLYYLSRQSYKIAGISYGLAVGAKLLPLMFGPYFLFKIIRSEIGRSFLSVAALTSLICLLPIGLSLYISGSQIFDSFGLYVSSFEFNGSIYYLLRRIGYLIFDINMIHILGPALSIITLGAIVHISWQKNLINDTRSVAAAMLIIYMIFILLSRTVHPWYALLPMLLGVISQIRYPIIWTYLICWTYINYSYTPYHENMTVVTIEYVILAGLIYHTYKRKKPATQIK